MLTSFLVAFGSIFSIVDPLSALPIFVALLGNHPRAEQLRASRRASLTCLIVLVLFGAVGTFIFRFFGITIPAFKIAGGIMLFGVAMEMMQAKISITRATDEEQNEAKTKENVGLIPLGTPLLSGPAAIAAVMVLLGKSKTMYESIGVYAAIILTALISYVVLRSAGLLIKWLGQTGINVIGRMMGLILAAVAVQFVIDGTLDAFPTLASLHAVVK